MYVQLTNICKSIDTHAYIFTNFFDSCVGARKTSLNKVKWKMCRHFYVNMSICMFVSK